ncbi:MAG: hypothetical protein WC262_11860 [Bacteroidales bacterium]|jgi:hypothetical protein
MRNLLMWKEWRAINGNGPVLRYGMSGKAVIFSIDESKSRYKLECFLPGFSETSEVGDTVDQMKQRAEEIFVNWFEYADLKRVEKE